MLPAARVKDMIVSTATVGIPTPILPPGAPTVLIAGLPAARMSDSCGVVWAQLSRRLAVCRPPELQIQQTEVMRCCPLVR